jgi:hypothetical protein
VSAGLHVRLGATFFLEPAATVGLNFAQHVVRVDGQEVFRLPPGFASLAIVIGATIF